MTEYWDLNTLPNGDQWLTITTNVEDPTYLTRRYLTSTDFKKLPNANGWAPTPVSQSDAQGVECGDIFGTLGYSFSDLTGRNLMRKMLLVLIAALSATGSLLAHHSYSATYDVGHQVKLEGKLVQFAFKNPHSFVTIQAPDESGAMQRWSIEWSGTSQLSDKGVTRETLKVGDAVVIVGNPSRVPGEFKALMLSLKRPSDGFAWGGAGGETVD